MKNKVAILAVLLGCQAVASSAALAFGVTDPTHVAGQAPLQLMVQADKRRFLIPEALAYEGKSAP